MRDNVKIGIKRMIEQLIIIGVQKSSTLNFICWNKIQVNSNYIPII